MKIKKSILLSLFKEMNKIVGSKKLFTDIYLNNDDFTPEQEKTLSLFLESKGIEKLKGCSLQKAFIESFNIGYLHFVRKKILYMKKYKIKDIVEKNSFYDYLFEISVPSKNNGLNKKELEFLVKNNYLDIKRIINDLTHKLAKITFENEKNDFVLKLNKSTSFLSIQESENIIQSLKDNLTKIYLEINENIKNKEGLHIINLDKREIYLLNPQEKLETVLISRNINKVKTFFKLNNSKFNNIDYKNCKITHISNVRNLELLIKWNSLSVQQLLYLHERIKNKKIMNRSLKANNHIELLNLINKKISSLEKDNIQSKIMQEPNILTKKRRI